MCRDVLDQIAACRRWRGDRANLQRARIATRLWLRCLGLADSLRRDDCDLIGRNSRLQVRKKASGGACCTLTNVRVGSKADIEAPPSNVRFTPNSGHCPCNYE